MSAPYTLENAVQYSIPIEPITAHGQYYTPMHTSPANTNFFTLAAGLAVGTAQHIDLKAPGEREQIARPQAPYLGQPRDSLFYSPYDLLNKPAVVDTENRMPSWLNDVHNHRMHEQIYARLRETKDAYHFGFQERGQFPVPPTGFSALATLRPGTTLATK